MKPPRRGLVNQINEHRTLNVKRRTSKMGFYGFLFVVNEKNETLGIVSAILEVARVDVSKHFLALMPGLVGWASPTMRAKPSGGRNVDQGQECFLLCQTAERSDHII